VSLTYIYYNVDTASFIEVFCENKEKPELACNGKCHLKKITNTTSKENTAPTQIIDFKDVLLYNVELSTCQFDTYSFKLKETFHYKNLYNFKLLETCFHPPNV
jgi:hypothetical protein